MTERLQANIEWAEKQIAYFNACLNMAHRQLASLHSPRDRSTFLITQMSRPNPGWCGYDYDRRHFPDMTEDYAISVVKSYQIAVDACKNLLARIKAGALIPNRLSDILIAFKNVKYRYQSEDSPYYWNKKGQPKQRKLSNRLGIKISRADINQLWPMKTPVKKLVIAKDKSSRCPCNCNCKQQTAYSRGHPIYITNLCNLCANSRHSDWVRLTYGEIQ